MGVNTGLILLLCIGVVLGGSQSGNEETGVSPSSTMETKSGEGEAVRPKVTPDQEAEQIYVDAYPEADLPDPLEIGKFAAKIVSIRQNFPRVAKVLNCGRWKLGQVEVSDFNEAVREKINKSPYGPIQAIMEREGQNAIIMFSKPYNPKVVSKHFKELGVKSREIWMRNGDFGHIEYDPEQKTYTFREGYDNCKPNCVDNHFWVFKFDAEGNPKLDSEYATDIPLPPRQPPMGS